MEFRYVVAMGCQEWPGVLLISFSAMPGELPCGWDKPNAKYFGHSYTLKSVLASILGGAAASKL